MIKYIKRLLNILIIFSICVSTLNITNNIHAIATIPNLKSTAINSTVGGVSLNWKSNSTSGAFYKGYTSTDGGVTWNTIPMIDFNNQTNSDIVKVLQIYPEVGENQLKDWVVKSGYGKGRLAVSAINMTKFNESPDRYLYRTSDGWNYDVIFFGTWDRNNFYDLSSKSYNVVKQFINEGRGCIFGHDTILCNSALVTDTREFSYGGVKNGQNYFNALATEYLPILGYVQNGYVGGSEVVIMKTGLFTTFPNQVGEIGDKLHIPNCHSWGQYVKSGYEDNVWLRYTSSSLNNSQNFYLTTYNNCAMIQTGHSSGAVTVDEQKILANLIFYCYQVTTKTSSTDYSATDKTAPTTPVLGIEGSKVTLSAEDLGTTYLHKIAVYDKSNFRTPIGETNTTTTVVKTGLAGYRYIIDDSPSTSCTMFTGSSTTSSEITYSTDDLGKYLHVAAYDKVGNISGTTTLYLNFNTISYNANGGTNAPSTQIKFLNQGTNISSQKPSRVGYDFVSWAVAGGNNYYNPGDFYNENKNLSLTAFWVAQEYSLDIYSNGSMSNVAGATHYSPTTATGINLKFDTGNHNRVNVATRTGYIFKGYYDKTSGGTQVYDSSGVFKQGIYWNAYGNYINPNNLVVYAQWTPRSDIHFKVNHYTQDLKSETYTLNSSEDYNNGVADSTINLKNYAKIIDGFTYSGGSLKGLNSDKTVPKNSYISTTTVNQDGTLVFNLYYTRNTYTLNVKNENNSGDNSFVLYYEEPLVIPDPVKDDYKFLGWYKDVSNSKLTSNGVSDLGGGSSNFIMGTANTTITASWSKLPEFKDEIISADFYEGQDINLANLKSLVVLKDADDAFGAPVLNIDSVEYNSTGKQDTNFDDSWKLNTSTLNLGTITINYSCDDIIPVDNNIADKKFDIVRVYYSRTVNLIYNDLPSMTLDSFVYTYSGDNTLTKDNIDSFIKSFVKVSDKQDSIDNSPWWSKLNTNSALQNNLIVRGVYDIIVDSGYERGHENTTRQIKAITSLSDLYSLKDTNKEAFNAIRSFNVELDAQDQWGKYVSGNLSKYAKDKWVVSNSEKDAVQSRSDRSILVIQTDDTTYNNAYEQIRFVSGAYLSSVGKNTYWGDSEYGKSKLENVLKLGSLVMKDGKLSNKVTITNKYVGSVNKVNNEHINIEVNYFKSK